MEHNDSLDDGDSDDFTPSSTDEEEEGTASQEQLLEGVASTDPIREYLKENRLYSAADPGRRSRIWQSANQKGTLKREEN